MKSRSWLSRAYRKPEYVWQPRRAFSRIRALAASRPAESTTSIKLPWGDMLEVDPSERIGRGIANTGVHDLTVSEVLWRLTDYGEIAVDAGANIGFFSVLCAQRVGSDGSVYALEPHPMVFDRLQRNARGAAAHTIRAHQAAVSSVTGEAILAEPRGFRRNQGWASLVEDDPRNSEQAIYHVACVCLDTLLANQRIGVLKLDVENHELEALRGATSLLESGRIRDIVFEEHRNYPTPVTAYLAKAGYTLFKLDKGMLGPLVQRARTGLAHASLAAPSYLATIDPERACRRLSPRGWQCLR